MPYKTVYVQSETVLIHNGIEVRKTYKNGDIEYPYRNYYKAMKIEDWENEIDEDEGHFDVTDLPNYSIDSDLIECIKIGIENGSVPISQD